MLPRSRRLHTARDYRTMWQGGRAIRGRFFVARIQPKSPTGAKFGCVVSTAVAKSAVTRNTIKRRLRSAVRPLLVSSNVNIVVYATKATITASQQEITNDLRAILTPTHAPHTRRPH